MVLPDEEEKEPEVTPEVTGVKPEVTEDRVEDNKENEEPLYDNAPEPQVEETKAPEKPEPKKVEPEPVKQEDSGEKFNAFGGVVLRRTGKLANIGEHGTLRGDKHKDAAKRQTIAGESGLVVFEPNVTQRKSVHGEPRDWEKLESQRKQIKEESPEETPSNSEFTAVLGKLKKTPSKKMSELMEKESRHSGEPKQEEPPKQEVDKQKTESPRSSSGASSVPAPVVVPPVIKQKSPEPERKSVIAKSTQSVKEVHFADELKSESPSSSRPSSRPSSIIKDSNKEEKEESSYKKKSPVLRDRERSKTVPSPKQTEMAKESPKIKRAGSSVTPATKPVPTGGENNNTESPAPVLRPALKSKPKVDPTPPVDNSSSNGAPAWIAMARRKTGQCRQIFFTFFKKEQFNISSVLVSS